MRKNESKHKSYPDLRMRENRKDETTRRAHRQVSAPKACDLMMPIFIKEGVSGKNEVKSMPGIHQFSLGKAVDEAKRIADAGIPSVILFGIPKHKDEEGTLSYDESGIVQQAIRSIKKELPSLTVVGDVCLCEYTSHGHCGIIKKTPAGDFDVDNDETIDILSRIALTYAKAGVDLVAPSAMMDGQVRAIRQVLDKNSLTGTKIMSYSAKYTSAFYGPFRDAAESPPQFGDRRTYQMDYHNSDEAILEARLDIEEGADILMVKPALGYQDIIYRIKKELAFPLACYSVSGEYSMIKWACAQGCLDEKELVLETLSGFRRAGADTIITYYAVEAARWLENK